jgi:creatinine amidohydrolase
MRLVSTSCAACVLALAATTAQQPARPAAGPRAGTRLATLAWPAASARLTPDTVVVLPLAAGAEQHGPHLPLGTDATLADYLVGRLLDRSDVVVAPPMTYHYAPAFLEYPGSASLSLTTARDLTADVARSLAGHGPRRYYVLNTGLSPRDALEQSAKLLAAEGILLRFTDARALLDPAARGVQRQLSGRHADEIETSMILQADPSAVDMDKAVRQYGPPPDAVPADAAAGRRGPVLAVGRLGRPHAGHARQGARPARRARHRARGGRRRAAARPAAGRHARRTGRRRAHDFPRTGVRAGGPDPRRLPGR